MTLRTISIQPATTAADIAEITRLMRTYAASLDVDLAYQDIEAELSGLPGKYAPPRGALLLARDAAGNAHGCVALRPLDDDGRCEMKRLYIAPAARGSGLGRRLAQAAISEATRRGYREIVLDTLPGMTGAQALYEKLGFVDIAPYYDTPIAGTRFMRRRLP